MNYKTIQKSIASIVLLALSSGLCAQTLKEWDDVSITSLNREQMACWPADCARPAAACTASCALIVNLSNVIVLFSFLFYDYYFLPTSPQTVRQSFGIVNLSETTDDLSHFR